MSMRRASQIITHLCAGTSSKSIPHRPDLVVKSQDEVKQVCVSMLTAWSDVDPATITLKSIKGGITNKLYLATAPGQKLKALVRLFGENTEVLINREQENRYLAELTHLNFGMHLLGTFNNGRVEEWFDAAVTMEPGDIQHPATSRLVAAKLADMHALPLSGDTAPVLFQSLKKWLDIARSCDFKDPNKRSRFLSLNIDRVENEIKELEVELSSIPSPVVFCHNDLLPGNILVDWKASPAPRLELIDMEYGGYNYRGFDIGNHFNEFAGFDYDKILEVYPNKAAQYNFFQAYLAQAKGGGKSSSAVTDDELDYMYLEANKYALASHLYWGLWAVVQARFSTIEFDYLHYARQRLSAYYQFKKIFKDLRP